MVGRNQIELKVGRYIIPIIKCGIEGYLFNPEATYKRINSEDKPKYDVFKEWIKSEENYISIGYLPMFLAIFIPKETAFMLADIAEYGISKPIEYSKEKRLTYIVKSLNSGLFKIGRTNHFYDEGKRSGRLTQLKCADPTIQEVLLIDGDFEYKLHEMFKHKNIKREWFKLDNNDLNKIKEISNHQLYKIDDKQLKLKL